MPSIYHKGKHTPATSRVRKYTYKIGLLPLLISLSACKQAYDVTFFGGIQIYDTTQRVMVEIPQGATNVYLTTDNNDPVASSNCSFKQSVITVDHPMVIKLRYDLDGTTINQTGLYVIEDNVRKSQLGNHVAIDIFEDFIRNHLNPTFGPTPHYEETKTIDDGMGGTATRTTTFKGLFNITGYQNVVFNNYKYHDPKNDTYFIATSGKIAGSMNKNGGSFGTFDFNGGEKLVFTGTYSGNADGQFYVDSNNNRYQGYYRVACADRWCAKGDAYYVLDKYREFVEIYPLPTDTPKSCK